MTFRITLLLLLVLADTSHGQSIVGHLKKNKAKGDEQYERKNYDQAIAYYKKALNQHQGDGYAKLRIAACYNQLDQWEKSREWFETAEKDTEITDEYAFQFGDALHHLGELEAAKSWYYRAQQSKTRPTVLQNRIRSVNESSKYYRDSSRVSVAPLSFNTDAAEFAPRLYRDGLIYTSYAAEQREELPRCREDIQYDMYYFPLQSDGLQKGEGPFTEINSIHHDGALALYDNNTQMIFTRSNEQASRRLKGKNHKINHLGLFHADYDTEQDRWTNVRALSLNNSEYSVGHPAITEDGTTLYFVSDMPGGRGGMDVYQSSLQDGSWSSPVNLGAAINTEANELFLFLHNDSILYFASEGHPGLGGMDIYKATVTSSHHRNAENVGYPINSTGDDFGMVITESGEDGFFTSNRRSKMWDDNIYRFTMKIPASTGGAAAEVSPKKLMIQGTVIDQQDKQPITGAVVMVMDAADVEVARAFTNSLGYFTMDVDRSKNYWIRTEKEEFYTYVAPLATVEKEEGYVASTIEVKKIEIGEKFRLENIYYDVNAYEVNDKATQSLKKVVELLQNNPKIKIELSSHTDSRGSNTFNLALSQKRAKAAVEYVISQGIDVSRVKAVGYGEMQLVFPCGDGIDCDEEQHLLNRRTEIKITDY